VTAARIHLVRHGHVENPRRIVYGRLPGWRLSAEGRRQAAAAAERLAGRPLAHVYTSPLERAVETAEAIASATGLAVTVDPDLVEAELGARWEGLSWTEVKTARRPEWEAYLHRPHEIAFVSETFSALGERMAGAIRRIAARHGGGEAAIVSHGDPIKAGLCVLTGKPIRLLHSLQVPTGSIVVVDLGEKASIVEQWAPAADRRR
jgi:probable phosphoglycerate mutase